MKNSVGLRGSVLHFKYLRHISDIPSEAWNKLAKGHGPFISHEFLCALEETNCATADTGWTPHHLVVSAANQTPSSLIAVLPLYIKQHSYGEYVFDWSWADAYHRNGLQYYPKLLTAIPFTPSYGARILVDSECGGKDIESLIISEVIAEAAKLGASSWHVLFPEHETSNALAKQRVHQRIGTQFHWFNKGYESFDQFLEAFSSRKRKNIRKERQRVEQAGIQFTHLEGSRISSKLWQQFFRFYQHTYEVRGQKGYLTLDFFLRLSQSMADHLLMVVAHKNGENIAAALSFKDSKKLYGRYWGCLQEYEFLHFETCYYQGIDYAIENKLESFDSGAQGEHKIQRGFEPIATYSNHWIRDGRFEEAIKDFLQDESEHSEKYRENARELLPFRHQT